MSGADANVVISIPTHKAPKWRVQTTRVMAARKMHRHAINRLSGALVNFLREFISFLCSPRSTSVLRYPTAYIDAIKNKPEAIPKKIPPNISGESNPANPDNISPVASLLKMIAVSRLCIMAVQISKKRPKNVFERIKVSKAATSGKIINNSSITINPAGCENGQHLLFQIC